MEIPKTLQEFLIWLGMQFPVLAASVFVGRWLLQWTAAKHAAEKEVIEKKNLELLDEKNIRIKERNDRIEELKLEIAALKAKLSRTRSKGTDQNGGPRS